MGADQARFGAASGEERSAYRRAVEEARRASGARVVLATRFDPVRAVGEPQAWAGLGTGAVQRTLALIRGFVPGFDPLGMTIRLDANPLIEMIHDSRRSVEAPFGDIARGALDDRVPALAATIAQVRHAVACPLLIAEQVDGVLCFLFSAPIDLATRRLCDAHAISAARTIARARHSARLQAELRAMGLSARSVRERAARMRRQDDSGGPGRLRIDYAALFGRPVGEVFAYVSDPRLGPKWQAGLVDVSVTPEGPVGAGSQVREVRQVLGQRVEMVYEVIACEADRRFVAAGSRPFSWESNITFEGHGRGAVATFAVEAEIGGLFRVAEPVVVRAVTRQLEADLANLNDILLAGVDAS